MQPPIPAGELPDLVDAELARVVREPWRVERLARGVWEVRPPHGWGGQRVGWPYYRVLVAEQLVVVTHGNSDAGAMHVGKLAQRATLVEAPADPLLFDARLGELLRRIFDTEPPNLEGLT